MNLINKFLLYSTRGYRFPERTKRILSIIIIPIWIVGLIFTIIFTIQGVKAIPLYFKAKKLIPAQIELSRNSSYNSNNNGLSHYSFNPGPWMEIGIENPTPSSTMMPQRGMEIQLYKMRKCLAPLIYFLLFFFIPFLILRSIYWVKAAE